MKTPVFREVLDPLCMPKPEAGSNILLVDDDLGAIQLMSAILLEVGKLRFATNGHDALRLARESEPDLILLDAEMPGMSGFELLKALKADSLLCAIPVIFITSHGEAGIEVSALDMGAADFIAKPLRSSRVLARVRTQLRVKLLTDELRRTATTDALTGVANRRFFDASIDREWRRARLEGTPVSLLMIDVDHFKRYNDLYGHPKGDACLQCVAQALLSASTRPADLVARYGGEEFAVLLPQMSREGAREIAQQSIEAVAAHGIAHQETGATHHVTVSVGIACYDAQSPCWTTLIDSGGTNTLCGVSDLVLAADKALYSAKHSGRAQAKLQEIDPLATSTELARSTPGKLVKSIAESELWQ
jgi:diguanylate cyclase (GGDEF)-like protein